MLKNEFPGKIETEEGISISFCTNFAHDKLDQSKPLLVFNYGLICNNKHWREQIPYFDQHGYSILYHDYRGHFESSEMDSLEELTFEKIALDIEVLTKHLKAKKLVMIGHSMGVNVCLEYARSHSENLEALILISGSAVPPQGVMFDNNTMDIIQPYLEWISKKFPKVIAPVWKNSYKNPIARKIIHRGGFNTQMVPDEFIQIYMKKIGELSPEIFFQLINQMRNQDILHHLENITTPTLIIGGDKDKVIPNYLQEILLKYLKNSEEYIVKNGSHVPQVDFPETINERIQIFLSKL
ncbi:MAG: alpha/beta hydrolase [Halobacteriovoraceae bacterium]|jgi:non-heme chloroperoxidase|nr:alpha/beta hydrolase [Halobacteriovoraceae bacterium]MBT5095182.1 alpha/beta hydrolase [Halobacteriovoraceae bacterium]